MVSYTYTWAPREFSSSYRRAAVRRPRGVVAIAASVAALVAGFVLVGADRHGTGRTVGGWLFWLGAYVLVLGAAMLALRPVISWRRNPFYAEPWTVTVSDEGVKMSTAVSTSSFAWQAVATLYETRAVAFFTLSASNRLILIPKRVMDARGLATLRGIAAAHT